MSRQRGAMVPGWVSGRRRRSTAEIGTGAAYTPVPARTWCGFRTQARRAAAAMATVPDLGGPASGPIAGLRGGPAPRGLVAPGQDCVRAVAGQLPGGGQAQAAARPGDDEGPAGPAGD